MTAAGQLFTWFQLCPARLQREPWKPWMWRVWWFTMNRQSHCFGWQRRSLWQVGGKGWHGNVGQVCYNLLQFICCFHFFMHSFMHSFIPSFLRSFVRSFLPSFLHSFIHSFSQSVSQSFIHSFICPFRGVNHARFREDVVECGKSFWGDLRS